ncbi:MAG TPA: virulence protein RhuM/Fic/DOC family protein [Bacteroidia bacterium]|nr:virulence protein RhuM/Fic/DOC family protein [Bacteroidia bacterium]
MNEIVIYKTEDDNTEIAVQFDGDTVWLTQAQIVELFQSSKANISEHIKSIFTLGELEQDATVRKFRTVRQEGKRMVARSLEHFNLDVIISIGYRVNTKRGIQFRQWATQRLKEYLVKGYTINQKRLDELGKMVQLIEQSGKSENLQLQEAKGLLEIISHYTQSFVLLNQYDSHSVKTGKLSENITYDIKYEEAKAAIAELKKQLIAKKEATDLFGKEKDSGFQSSLQSIVQTFGGQYLYPSIEEQAAHLLYFVIKNHSFNDGNKRIGAFLFIWFLEKNKHRFKANGEIKINDNGLTAIALLVAQSKPEEKELMIQLIVSLVANQSNPEIK